MSIATTDKERWLDLWTNRNVQSRLDIHRSLDIPRFFIEPEAKHFAPLWRKSASPVRDVGSCMFNERLCLASPTSLGSTRDMDCVEMHDCRDLDQICDVVNLVEKRHPTVAWRIVSGHFVWCVEPMIHRDRNVSKKSNLTCMLRVFDHCPLFL